MLKLIKTFIKEAFPQSVLRWRARKILSGNMDPDLNLIAHITRHLTALPGGQAFVEYFSKGKTGIDVGACGGEYSIIMADMFQRVLAIEPTADMASRLRSALPSNCEVVECVLGDKPGQASLRVPKKDGSRLHALATVAEHGFAFSDIGAVDTAVVKQCTLDQLVLDRGITPSFVKIDVEGYEGKVLSGAVNVIKTCRPVFIVEIEKRHNKDFAQIFSLLGSYGYVPYHFRAGALAKSDPSVVEDSYEYLRKREVSGMDEVIESKMSEHYTNNFVFLPQESSGRRS
jgi:FkbM family methyltransferase